MKAPASEQLILLDLQAADTRLNQLTHAVRTLPQSVALVTLRQETSNARALATSIRGELEDTKIEIARLENDAVTVSARIQRDRDLLLSSGNTKEIQGLEHELNSLLRRQSDLEDIELTVMERQEEIEGRFTGASGRLDDLVVREAGLLAERDVRLGQLTRETEALMKSRAAIAGTISEALLALYDKTRERYGVGAALLTKGISGGSHVALHESDLQAIRAAAADEVVLCPDSNCILVRTTESGL